MRHLRRAAHAIVATAALHLSFLASERFKDAYVDVALDHSATIVEALLKTPGH